ncbi:MAG: tRNA pseudouridine(55) synthase TruB [Dehalococcoidia bacterium]
MPPRSRTEPRRAEPARAQPARAQPARAQPAHHGILLVDKPAGWTSHDVVAKVRGLARQRSIGHTGTLDPMATGLLVLCLGPATRLVEYMAGHDKTYEGDIRLGAATTTDDAEGEVTETAPIPALTADLLRALEAEFTGTIQQVPPAFSAVKIAGQRAYAVARKGGAPALQPRPVTIHTLHLEPGAADTLRIRVTCGAGTYVRSLARDMGRALGSAGHLAALRRTRAGLFDIDDAWPLDDLITLAGAGLFAEALLPPDEGVADLAAAILSTERAARLANGSRLEVESEVPIAVARVYDSEGKFVAVGQVRDDRILLPLKVFTL